MFCTRTAQETAADATQIFGGRAISECCIAFLSEDYFLARSLTRLVTAQTGMGKNIEHYHRTVTFDALLGGGAFSSAAL